MIVPAQLEQHERIKVARARMMAPAKPVALPLPAAPLRAIAGPPAVQRLAALPPRIIALLERVRTAKADDSVAAILSKYRLVYDSSRQPRTQSGVIKTIQRQVAQIAGLAPKELKARRRSTDIVQPRQFAMWLARKNTPLSLSAIGRLFGGCDHATVLHACRKVEERLAANEIDEALLPLVRRTFSAEMS